MPPKWVCPSCDTLLRSVSATKAIFIASVMVTLVLFVPRVISVTFRLLSVSVYFTWVIALGIALLPSVTPLGYIISLSVEQLLNAYFPIEVTLLGIVTDVRTEQP